VLSQGEYRAMSLKISIRIEFYNKSIRGRLCTLKPWRRGRIWAKASTKRLQDKRPHGQKATDIKPQDKRPQDKRPQDKRPQLPIYASIALLINTSLLAPCFFSRLAYTHTHY